MPDAIDNTVNSFMVEIQKIEDQLKNDLERLAYKMKDMTDTELLATTRRLNFLQELVDKGYGQQVNNLMDIIAEMDKKEADQVHRALQSGKINQDNYDKVMSKLIGSKK